MQLCCVNHCNGGQHHRQKCTRALGSMQACYVSNEKLYLLMLQLKLVKAIASSENDTKGNGSSKNNLPGNDLMYSPFPKMTSSYSTQK